MSGESYAGIYVPYLAWEIYQNNLQADFDPSLYHININGTMVGNGATDWDFDSNPSFPDTVYNFNLIPKRTIDKYHNNDCHAYFRDIYPATNSTACDEAIEQMENLTSTLNWYDLYRNPVPDSPLLKDVKGEGRYGTTMVNGVQRKYKRGFTMSEYTPWARHIKGERQMILGDYVSDYMN